jgi:hypothetical protein
VILPFVIILGGAGGLGLYLRGQAKKKKMLSKVPPEPDAGAVVFFKRGPYYVVVRKSTTQRGGPGQDPVGYPPLVWAVFLNDAIAKAPGATELERVTAAAKDVPPLVAIGALTYDDAVLRSQVWVQGLIGNTPAAPKPAEYVAFGRAKGLLTLVIGQVPKLPPGDSPPTPPFAPQDPPIFVWVVGASSMLRDAVASGGNVGDVLEGDEANFGFGMASTYKDAVKAADDKAKSLSFALWGHKPPYGTMDMIAIDAALRRRKKAA